MKLAHSKERTAHGLWIVQRAFHVYSDLRADFDWCTAVNDVKCESYDRFRLWYSAYCYRAGFSAIYIVDRCARRYVRRWPHLIRKGAQYNRLVDRICDRMQAHPQTRKHALRFHFSSHRIVLDDSGDLWYLFCPLKVVERKKRMEQLKRAFIFYELQETESELKHIRRAIRNAQSALRSANA